MWVIFSRSEAMGDGGVVFVFATEVEVKVAATSEFSGTQRARVVVTFGVKDDNVVLAFSTTGGGEITVSTAKDRLR